VQTGRPCEGHCVCQKDHASPETPLPPPTSRNQTVENLSSPPVAMVGTAAELPASAEVLLADPPIRFDSSAERCVLLSKLVL
jgi:hypothetical protein